MSSPDGFAFVVIFTPRELGGGGCASNAIIGQILSYTCAIRKEALMSDDLPAALSFAVRKAQPADGPAILKLIYALADFEKLPPPDADAQARLLADAFAERPRFDVFLAEAG